MRALIALLLSLLLGSAAQAQVGSPGSIAQAYHKSGGSPPAGNCAAITGYTNVICDDFTGGLDPSIYAPMEPQCCASISAGANYATVPEMISTGANHLRLAVAAGSWNKGGPGSTSRPYVTGHVNLGPYGLVYPPFVMEWTVRMNNNASSTTCGSWEALWSLGDYVGANYGTNNGYEEVDVFQRGNYAGCGHADWGQAHVHYGCAGCNEDGHWIANGTDATDYWKGQHVFRTEVTNTVVRSWLDGQPFACDRGSVSVGCGNTNYQYSLAAHNFVNGHLIIMAFQIGGTTNVPTNSYMQIDQFALYVGNSSAQPQPAVRAYVTSQEPSSCSPSATCTWHVTFKCGPDSLSNLYIYGAFRNIDGGFIAEGPTTAPGISCPANTTQTVDATMTMPASGTMPTNNYYGWDAALSYSGSSRGNFAPRQIVKLGTTYP